MENIKAVFMGLGYIGLPTATVAAGKGLQVVEIEFFFRFLMYVTVIVRDVFGFEFGRYVYDTGCGKLAIAGHKPFVVGHDKFHVVDMEVGIVDTQ